MSFAKASRCTSLRRSSVSDGAKLPRSFPSSRSEAALHAALDAAVAPRAAKMMTWRQSFKNALKRPLTDRQLVRARSLLRGKPWPRWGNLRRVTPFSMDFGFDRGTPIDRFYLHDFLDRHRNAITGDVLEIESPGYTRQYGHDVRTAHSVDINPELGPTYTCDLALSD